MPSRKSTDPNWFAPGVIDPPPIKPLLWRMTPVEKLLLVVILATCGYLGVTFWVMAWGQAINIIKGWL